MISAAIYVDGKPIGEVGVTATTEISEAHSQELAYQVRKVLNEWIKAQPVNDIIRPSDVG